MRIPSLLLATTAVLLALTAPAVAAPPANDDRAAAAPLTAGADVTGTTVDATREASDPPNCPRNGGATVWYRYTAPRSGPARVLLETRGKLDASLSIYAVERSTITRIACEDTVRGTALLEGSLDSGAYLIRISEREGSLPGSFRLRFSGVLTEPTGSGRPLPASGRARGSLNALTRPFLRVSRRLLAGHDYRVRVALGRGGDCDSRVRLIAPGGDVRRYLDCRDYTVITPGPDSAGRYTIAAETGTFGTSAADEPYDVSITPVGPDDLAPGRFIGGFGRAHGSVSGRGPDAEDVFRFDVTKRAEITLRLHSAGSMRLSLRTERGRRVTSTSVEGDTGQIRTRLRPGRFYLIVSAANAAGGRYTLSRLTRVITSTRVTWGGSGTREQPPGGSGTVQVTTTAAAAGRAIVTVERFDPQFGWRFYRRKNIAISGGRGSLTVPTQAIGRYRAKAEFLGTRKFSPSRARRAAYLRVVAPLRD